MKNLMNTNKDKKFFGMVTSLIIALMFSQTLYAGNTVGGAGDAGGGNGLKSTPVQIKKELEKLKEHTIKALLFPGGSLVESDPRIASLIQKMGGQVVSEGKAYLQFNSDEKYPPVAPLVKAIQQSKIVVKEAGSCNDGGEESDASTVVGQIGADVCFSIDRLKQVSPIALHQELIALFLHELAHQFSVRKDEEDLAKKFQEIVSIRLNFSPLYLAIAAIKFTSPQHRSMRIAASGALTVLVRNEHFADKYMNRKCMNINPYTYEGRELENLLLNFHTWVNSPRGRESCEIKRVNSLEELSLIDDLDFGLEMLWRTEDSDFVVPKFNLNFDRRAKEPLLLGYADCVQRTANTIVENIDKSPVNNRTIKKAYNIETKDNSENGVQ